MKLSKFDSVLKKIAALSKGAALSVEQATKMITDRYNTWVSQQQNYGPMQKVSMISYKTKVTGKQVQVPGQRTKHEVAYYLTVLDPEKIQAVSDWASADQKAISDIMVPALLTLPSYEGKADIIEFVYGGVLQY